MGAGAPDVCDPPIASMGCCWLLFLLGLGARGQGEFFWIFSEFDLVEIKAVGFIIAAKTNFPKDQLSTQKLNFKLVLDQKPKVAQEEINKKDEVFRSSRD